MKKLIILITIILCSLSYAQMNGKWIVDNEARIYTDSLQFEVSDSLAQKDSVWILNFNFNPSSVRIYVKGNANSSVDSIGVQFGFDVYNESGTLIETNYGSYTALKDSGWNTVSTIINNSVGKDYSVYQFPAYGKLKLSLLNYRAALLTRKVQITVQAFKQ